MDDEELRARSIKLPSLSEKFLGVFPADALPSRRLPAPHCFVFNTRPSHENGHWVAVNCARDEELEIFDSLGINFYPCFSEYAKGAETLEYQSERLQRANSDACGLYCLYFLSERSSKGRSFASVVGDFGDSQNANDKMVRIYGGYSEP